VYSHLRLSPRKATVPAAISSPPDDPLAVGLFFRAGEDTSMNASQSAETYARQVAGLPSVEEKIDRLARAIVELAVAVQGIERRLERLK
jgi:hypothetical protein